MLAGIVYGALGLLESQKDLIPFALFCGGSFIIALLIQVSNHVPLALLVIGGLTAVILAIQSVRTYQFRKQYTGA
jgi:cell division protein FtsW (lipid II flippase)